jgi:hypothetical protein
LLPFQGVNIAAKFDAKGNQTNALLGQIDGAASPRRLQLALRLNF